MKVKIRSRELSKVTYIPLFQWNAIEFAKAETEHQS